jgi:hypothetical protein
MRLKLNSFIFCTLLTFLASNCFSQTNRIIACKPAAFAAIKALPELNYACPEDIIESSDLMLKLPERASAINAVIKNLESFSSPDWWNTAVDDLNACYLRGKPGKLTTDELNQFTDEEFQSKLLGNNRIRLVLVPDPCYQTYYNGANIFLLYKKGEKISVTEAIDGYFSRLPNSVSLKVFRLGADEVIEIETVNIWGMRPHYTSFYFVIDKITGKAVEVKLSGNGKRKVFKRLKKQNAAFIKS